MPPKIKLKDIEEIEYAYNHETSESPFKKCFHCGIVTRRRNDCNEPICSRCK